ncbi:MAG TPA: SH3 domain-containing protein [Thermoanaerobaculia bacterium]|nr:SH3 domain-containing protein [Thermoanaerobaculia bacterium]
MARVLALAWVLVALCGPLAAQPDEPAAAQPLGAPAGWARIDRPTRVLPPDTEVRAEPSPLARSLVRLDAEVEVEVLEEQEGWIRVRVGEVKGWVPTGSSAAFVSSPGAGLGDQRLELQAARLDRARDLLTDGEMRRTGSLEWWTDLHAESSLIDRLDSLFACFSEAYERRYGLDRPVYADPDVAVVFTQEEAYRRFVAGEAEVADLASGGFSAIGFAAFYAGGRLADDVAAIAAHELAHLENRRRLAHELPPWLEEGLAEDMALLAAAGVGCPESGWPRISRREWRTGSGRKRALNVIETMSGKLRSLACTVEGWGRAPLDLGELTGLGWERFSAPEGRSFRYAASALLVRFLLDGGNASQRAEAFRSYLRAGRDTGSFGWEALLDRLGFGERELSAALREWAASELGDALARLPCS